LLDVLASGDIGVPVQSAGQAVAGVRSISLVATVTFVGVHPRTSPGIMTTA
jgi:hypothetical protein